MNDGSKDRSSGSARFVRSARVALYLLEFISESARAASQRAFGIDAVSSRELDDRPQQHPECAFPLIISRHTFDALLDACLRWIHLVAEKWLRIDARSTGSTQ